MTPRGCSTAKSLLDLHNTALVAFHRANDPMFAGIAPGHQKYAEVHELREQAYLAMHRTRRLYWQHIDEHGCPASGPTEPECKN